MNEANEQAQISLHKVSLLVGIMQRQISIEEALANEDAEKVRILSLAQYIDIDTLRRYLNQWEQETNEVVGKSAEWGSQRARGYAHLRSIEISGLGDQS